MIQRNLIKGLVTCRNNNRYAILNIINSVNGMSYKKLSIIIKNREKNIAAFAYHIKELKRHGLVEINPCSRHYEITELGKIILKIYEAYSEKYMIEETILLCKNDTNNNHDFVTICRNCGELLSVPKITHPSLLTQESMV